MLQPTRGDLSTNGIALKRIMLTDDLGRSALAKVLPSLQESLRNLLGVECED
jgi:hypothetical protein